MFISRKTIKGFFSGVALAMASALYVASYTPDIAQAQVVNPSQPGTNPTAGTAISVAGSQVNVLFGDQSTLAMRGSAGTCGTMSCLRIFTQGNSLFNQVQGYWTRNDGGGGLYALVSSDTTSGAFYTGSVTGTVLTVTAVTNGTLAAGQLVTRSDTGVPVGWISSLGTGVGGTGTYNLASSSGNVGSQTMMADNGGSIVVSSIGGRWYLVQPDAPVSVKQFGAKCDGSTVDTFAFQAEINWIQLFTFTSANGGGRPAMRIPGGYCITDSLTIPHRMVVRGDGSGSSFVGLVSGSTGNLFNVTAENPGPSLYDAAQTEFSGLTLVGNKANSTIATSSGISFTDAGFAIGTQYGTSGRLNDLVIFNFNNDGIYQGVNRNWLLANNLIVRYNNNNGWETFGYDNRVQGSDFGVNGNVGVYFQAGGANICTGCNIYLNKFNVVASPFHNSASDFYGCYFDSPLQTNITVSAPSASNQPNIVRIYGGRIYSSAGSTMPNATYPAISIASGAPAATFTSEIFLVGTQFIIDSGAPKWTYLVSTGGTTPKVIWDLTQYDNAGGALTPYTTAETDDFTALNLAGDRDANFGKSNGVAQSLAAYINGAAVSVTDTNGMGLVKGALGYRAGSGGSVVQATSKSTGVTLNTATGQITMNAASLAANTTVSFTLTDSQIALPDVLLVQPSSGFASGQSYNVWASSIAAGSITINVRNITAGALSEAVVLNYTIIKGSGS